MKILWISHLIPYPPKGGVLQRSYYLLRELSKYYEIDLLAFNQKKLLSPLVTSLNDGIDEANSVLSSICRRISFNDIPNYSTPIGPYLLAIKSLLSEPYTINWLKSKNFRLNLGNWLHDCNYNLVHFDTISLVPYFHLIPQGIPTVLDHHNIESHMLLRRAENETNLLKRFYFWQEGVRLAKYERNYCPRFTLNITCSDIDSERLVQLAPHSNVHTIPNGVDLDYFKPQGISTQPNRIIFVGTMNWYPNIEAVQFIAEKLWPVLKLKHPDLVCDIIGANPPSSIRTLAESLLDFNVHGFVDDVRPFIEAATVYVCPIRDGGGTKLKILDAMAMAKAIVAHPIACEGINVTHHRNILLAENENSFIEHIDTLLKSSDIRESLGRAARVLMEQAYGYTAIGKLLSETFQSCMK